MHLFDVELQVNGEYTVHSVLAASIIDAVNVTLRITYERGIPAVLTDVESVYKIRGNVSQ